MAKKRVEKAKKKAKSGESKAGILIHQP